MRATSSSRLAAPRFIGRGRTLALPRALTRSRAAVGDHRRGARSGARAAARACALAAGQASADRRLHRARAETREAALELARHLRRSSQHRADLRARLGRRARRAEAPRDDGSAGRALAEAALGAALPRPELRARADAGAVHGSAKDALWSYGISGDLPILLLRVDDPSSSSWCRELLLAHEYWRLNGVAVDLVILNEEPSGYNQPLQEADPRA